MRSMEMKRILCPIDTSPCSDEALVHAIALARQNGALLDLLRVTEVPPAYADGLPVYSREAAEAATDREGLRELPVPADVRHEKHHRIGDAATEILEFAQRHEVDLIVMGTHGRRGLGRMLFGSVAEKVLRQAPCPVLTYRVSTRTPRNDAASQGDGGNPSNGP